MEGNVLTFVFCTCILLFIQPLPTSMGTHCRPMAQFGCIHTLANPDFDCTRGKPTLHCGLFFFES